MNSTMLRPISLDAIYIDKGGSRLPVGCLASDENACEKITLLMRHLRTQAFMLMQASPYYASGMTAASSLSLELVDDTIAHIDGVPLLDLYVMDKEGGTEMVFLHFNWQYICISEQAAKNYGPVDESDLGPNCAAFRVKGKGEPYLSLPLLEQAIFALNIREDARGGGSDEQQGEDVVVNGNGHHGPSTPSPAAFEVGGVGAAAGAVNGGGTTLVKSNTVSSHNSASSSTTSSSMSSASRRRFYRVEEEDEAETEEFWNLCNPPAADSSRAINLGTQSLGGGGGGLRRSSVVEIVKARPLTLNEQLFSQNRTKRALISTDHDRARNKKAEQTQMDGKSKRHASNHQDNNGQRERRSEHKTPTSTANASTTTTTTTTTTAKRRPPPSAASRADTPPTPASQLANIMESTSLMSYPSSPSPRPGQLLPLITMASFMHYSGIDLRDTPNDPFLGTPPDLAFPPEIEFVPSNKTLYFHLDHTYVLLDARGGYLNGMITGSKLYGVSGKRIALDSDEDVNSKIDRLKLYVMEEAAKEYLAETTPYHQQSSQDSQRGQYVESRFTYVPESLKEWCAVRRRGKSLSAEKQEVLLNSFFYEVLTDERLDLDAILQHPAERMKWANARGADRGVMMHRVVELWIVDCSKRVNVAASVVQRVDVNQVTRDWLDDESERANRLIRRCGIPRDEVEFVLVAMLDIFGSPTYFTFAEHTLGTYKHRIGGQMDAIHVDPHTGVRTIFDWKRSEQLVNYLSTEFQLPTNYVLPGGRDLSRFVANAHEGSASMRTAGEMECMDIRFKPLTDAKALGRKYMTQIAGYTLLNLANGHEPMNLRHFICTWHDQPKSENAPWTFYLAEVSVGSPLNANSILRQTALTFHEREKQFCDSLNT